MRPPRPISPPTPTERRVTLAVVTGAHGIRGEVRLKVFAEDLGRHRTFNDGTLKLTSLREGIARFDGIDDRNAAEAMRGTELTVPRAALPPLEPGEYYHADLIGLAAVADTGVSLGRVVAVDNYGATDVVEIERPDGRRFLVPMTPVAVPAWDDDTLTVNAAFVE